MVTTLEEGIDLIKAGEADVVVIDLLLPETTPNEILDLVKETARKIPIVALTTDERIDVALEAFRRGAQDYLIKSRVTGDLIERSVRYAIERKRIDERLNQVNDNLQQYAYIVSHDLKQPLSSNIILLSLLEKRYKGKLWTRRPRSSSGMPSTVPPG
jgi:DNA-binding NarL/FixJ family response regulator